MAQSTNNFNVLIPERPRYLYFVQHASSRARMTNDGGFEAADNWTTPYSCAHLQQLIMNHVNWTCRIPSCFISTFGSFDHAYDWGMQRHRPITIHQIDTNQMHPQRPIFTACYFTPNCCVCEYLFLHDIAGSSITYRYSLPGSIPLNETNMTVTRSAWY
ncbi:uncharacterized protein B0T23DRAFT_134160 [Neurospora hispaniola]|uniref:DUF7587 domain-containing protein n=1 Tax=Neurospora hispaniola TaxID=588809 RepID=A0AAJ0I766_9PEZI|nr:hypothetical protein B0T23DRAFT_134160 [Neurospora hispaniola]